MTPISNCSPTKAEFRTLLTSSIRKDGKTQQRFAMNSETVAEYAALMRDGVQFPPVRVWYDGEHHWLTDGFHRLAAAAQANRIEMSCEVYRGTLSDARWDSYAANTTHGLRRAPTETQNVIALALQHSNAARFSNMQIAKHLNVSEITIRRWRKRLSSTGGEDAVRIVTRRGTYYEQKTFGIGKNSHPERRRFPKDLKAELRDMKGQGSPNARRVLNVVGNWAFGRTNPKDCLASIEQILRDLTAPTHQAGTLTGF